MSPDWSGDAPLDAAPLDREDLLTRVAKELDDHLAHQQERLDAVSPDLSPLMETIVDLLRGGKRLRAGFCYWGWRGAGGPDVAGIVTVAASLELFQAAALIHDDVMDASDTRRGLPAVHRRLAALHRGNSWLGSSDAFGVAGAVLAGDLCLSWCDEMYAAADLPAADLRRGRAVFDRMRTELMSGQYLDMLEQVRAETSVERARHVIRYKSANYTVAQPLMLGAGLAGAGDDLVARYADFGRAVGEAFQLRDDVLGVFGDPATTGKPAGDDLREGKRTVLVAMAMEDASPAQAAELRRGIGDERLDASGVERLREILLDTGAVDRVESLIAELRDDALATLRDSDVAAEARGVLERLVVAATARAL